MNASTIVTTKYFRGALGTPAREHSLRQLIDRVVKTYRKAGRGLRVFRRLQSAEVFEHELTWMLLHQYFSFNSPVWFNVGTASPQQVSAPASRTRRWSARLPVWSRSASSSRRRLSAPRCTTHTD